LVYQVAFAVLNDLADGRLGFTEFFEIVLEFISIFLIREQFGQVNGAFKPNFGGLAK
jgi:hypothetical protein